LPGIKALKAPSGSARPPPRAGALQRIRVELPPGGAER
jgi:hypothetical protein